MEDNGDFGDDVMAGCEDSVRSKQGPSPEWPVLLLRLEKHPLLVAA